MEQRSDPSHVQKNTRLARSSGSRDEPPAVLCGICRTGIGSLAELAMTAVGPTHIRCQPTEPDPQP